MFAYHYVRTVDEKRNVLVHLSQLASSAIYFSSAEVNHD